ncbi:hypothetical protein ACWIG5_06385 [Streptomyces lydicus]
MSILPRERDGHPHTPGEPIHYRSATAPGLVARLIGKPHELLGLNLDEADYAVATVEGGMEVDAPAYLTHGAWSSLVPEVGDLRRQSSSSAASHGQDGLLPVA